MTLVILIKANAESNYIIQEQENEKYKAYNLQDIGRKENNK